jgi:uncharacterized protein
MSEALLETMIVETVEGQDTPEVHLSWQGGEPLLLGVDFFRRVVDLEARHARGKRIVNGVQTNGLLLDDALCELFAREGFLVGISLDGPQGIHDANRRGPRGEPTFEGVMRAIDLLRSHGTAWNLLSVIHRENAQDPLRTYRLLKSASEGHIQLIPLVERILPSGRHADPPDPVSGSLGPAATVSPLSVTPEAWGRFLVEIWDAWVRDDIGRVFVQIFEAALGSCSGLGSSLCVNAPTCGDAVVVEHDGGVYACDHYVLPPYRIGTLGEEPLAAMVASRRQRDFGAAKRDRLPPSCLACDVRNSCHGDCPKHRFLDGGPGEAPRSWLCEGYRQFFRHAEPTLRILSRLLLAGREPAEIGRHPITGAPPPERNASCPCGSGLKYKRCCGATHLG